MASVAQDLGVALTPVSGTHGKQTINLGPIIYFSLLLMQFHFIDRGLLALVAFACLCGCATCGMRRYHLIHQSAQYRRMSSYPNGTTLFYCT